MMTKRSVLIGAVVAVLAMMSTAYAQPAAPGVPFTRVAFGSCAHQDAPQPIWDAVLAYKPDVFLFTGDNVYGNQRDGKAVTAEEVPATLGAAYAKVLNIPGFKALRATTPILATWDDNDYGTNDAGADFPLRREVQKQFVDFWDLPTDDPRRTRDAVYHAQVFGTGRQRIQIIVLDTRFFRSPLKPSDQRGAPGKERYIPDDDPAKTMLGDVQWAWLAERFREPAEVRIVVSSVQLVAEGHGWERWGNFPRERQRFYDLVRDTGAEGVVVVSGDRHIGAIYRQDAGAPYPIYDITSSGLNVFYAAAKEDGPNRLGPLFGQANFGTVDIDWWSGELRLAVRDVAGQVVRSHAVALTELKRR